jgi:hypothetical protein
MSRPITVSLFVLAIVSATASSAWAQPAGNPFHIDGVVTDFINSGVAGGFTIPPCDPPPATGAAPQACKQNDDNGNTQELGPVNSNETKIDVIHNAHIAISGKVGPVNCTPAAPCYQSMLGTTNPNAQVDLNASWIQSAIAPVGGVPHVFLYFAWRRDSASGSGFISLEVQKAQAGGFRDNCNYDLAGFNPDNCNPWAGRQGGDIIFLWDQSGSDTDIIAAGITGPAAWNGIPPDGPRTLALPDCSHSSECADLSVANVAYALFGTNCGEGFEPGQCGEMVIDLTALGVFSPNPTRCESIANIIPGTVTGNSNSADYKDVVLAPFPTISNCGTVTVTKRTVAPNGTTVITGPETVFGYTLARVTGNVRFADDIATHTEDGPTGVQIVRPNSFPAGGAGQPGLTQCTNTNALPLACGPVISHAELAAAANYTLVESAPPVPWIKLSIVCRTGTDTAVTLASDTATFEVRPNTTTVCVITNQLQLGSPTAESRQRVIIADRVRINGIIAGGSNNTTPGALARDKVRLTLYSGQCGAAGTVEGTFDFTLTFSTPANGQQTATMSGFSSPNLEKIITTAGGSTFYWGFEWHGDTFNNPVTLAQSCTSPAESVTVTISAPQANIPD